MWLVIHSSKLVSFSCADPILDLLPPLGMWIRDIFRLWLSRAILPIKNKRLGEKISFWRNTVVLPPCCFFLSVTDPDPGSSVFLPRDPDPGSENRDSGFQCCGSGPWIRCAVDPLYPGPGSQMEKSGPRIFTPDLTLFFSFGCYIFAFHNPPKWWMQT